MRLLVLLSCLVGAAFCARFEPQHFDHGRRDGAEMDRLRVWFVVSSSSDLSLPRLRQLFDDVIQCALRLQVHFASMFFAFAPQTLCKVLIHLWAWSNQR